jgi:hypothetical protein
VSEFILHVLPQIKAVKNMGDSNQKTHLQPAAMGAGIQLDSNDTELLVKQWKDMSRSNLKSLKNIPRPDWESYRPFGLLGIARNFVNLTNNFFQFTSPHIKTF